MKVFLIAAVAVTISGTAFAKDLKGSVMTDSEMDKVTAGDVVFFPCAQPTGCGIFTGNAASNLVLQNHLTPGFFGGSVPPYPAGAGTYTASIVKQ